MPISTSYLTNNYNCCDDEEMDRVAMLKNKMWSDDDFERFQMAETLLATPNSDWGLEPNVTLSPSMLIPPHEEANRVGGLLPAAKKQ